MIFEYHYSTYLHPHDFWVGAKQDKFTKHHNSPFSYHKHHPHMSAEEWACCCGQVAHSPATCFILSQMALEQIKGKDTNQPVSSLLCIYCIGSVHVRYCIEPSPKPLIKPQVGRERGSGTQWSRGQSQCASLKSPCSFCFPASLKTQEKAMGESCFFTLQDRKL